MPLKGIRQLAFLSHGVFIAEILGKLNWYEILINDSISKDSFRIVARLLGVSIKWISRYVWWMLKSVGQIMEAEYRRRYSFFSFWDFYLIFFFIYKWLPISDPHFQFYHQLLMKPSQVRGKRNKNAWFWDNFFYLQVF